MFWRVKWDLLNYRIMWSRNPYSFRDFLEIEPIHPFVSEHLLNYEFDDETDLPVPDFQVGAIGGVLVCTREVWKWFEPLKITNFRTYQGRCDGIDLQFNCCLLEISGFDFEKSSYRTFEGDEEIEVIHDLKLREYFYTPYDIFRLNDNWGCRFELLVSDKFKEIYDENELTGLSFLAT